MAADIKHALKGEWASIAPELRPSGIKNADGSAKPFYLTRAFRYDTDDSFQLTVVTFADANGKVPLARIVIDGHIAWQGDHPIAAGAQKANFIADKAYVVTPLAQGFADVLNTVASLGFERWEVSRGQSVMGKAFAPFGLAQGQVFSEYDLIYLRDNLLYWGARHVDGRGFDTEDNRPTNLQIPMAREHAGR